MTSESETPTETGLHSAIAKASESEFASETQFA